jgi:hypothetical protein
MLRDDFALPERFLDESIPSEATLGASFKLAIKASTLNNTYGLDCCAKLGCCS